MSYTVSLPLLHDHHSHVSLYAAMEGQPDLFDLVAGEAHALLRSLPTDRLNVVKGWKTHVVPLPREFLAALPPVIVVNATLHGFAYSPAAIPFIARLWPEFAEHLDDKAWGERSLPDLFAFYGQIAGLDAGKLASFMEKVERLGIGSIEDMSISGADALEVIRASAYAKRISVWATPRVYSKLSPGDRDACKGLKIFLDGSLGAKSAGLDVPFLDGIEGYLLYSDEDLGRQLRELAGYGTALSVHAIGHRAIEQALRMLGNVEDSGLSFPQVRLEHVQYISESQARRARDRGYLFSMQPNFSADSMDFADRLPPRLLRENNPFRMLIDRVGCVPGRDLIFGSDGMPHGIENALQWSLFPAFDGQRLTADELQLGYSRTDQKPGAPSTRLLIDEGRRDVRLRVSV